ncbi:Uncharacterised protein [Klebsiella aerogenes]|nr:Uncharacterised protein [Klebsiella aerogenes]
MCFKTDVIHHRIARGIHAGQVLHFHQWCTEAAIRGKKMTYRIASQHFTDDPWHINFTHPGLRLEFAVTQNGNDVADGHQLFQTV